MCELTLPSLNLKILTLTAVAAFLSLLNASYKCRSSESRWGLRIYCS